MPYGCVPMSYCFVLMPYCCVPMPYCCIPMPILLCPHVVLPYPCCTTSDLIASPLAGYPAPSSLLPHLGPTSYKVRERAVCVWEGGGGYL